MRYIVVAAAFAAFLSVPVACIRLQQRRVEPPFVANAHAI